MSLLLRRGIHSSGLRLLGYSLKRDRDEEVTPRRTPTKEFRFENRGNPDGLKQFASGLS